MSKSKTYQNSRLSITLILNRFLIAWWVTLLLIAAGGTAAFSSPNPATSRGSFSHLVKNAFRGKRPEDVAEMVNCPLERLGVKEVFKKFLISTNFSPFLLPAIEIFFKGRIRTL